MESSRCVHPPVPNLDLIFAGFDKFISVLLKDLDVFARNSIKDELASLDPLLRNVSVPVGNDDEGRAIYEFDPEH
jgi:hypothetical protein